MLLTPHEKEFLTKLAGLLAEYDASFEFKPGVGVCIEMQGAAVYTGFIIEPDDLREVCDS